MFSLVSALMLCMTIVAATQAQLATPLSDDRAIRELVARYNAARELDDPAAIGALFTDDADQLVSSGEWRRGRGALVEGMQRSSRSNPGRRTLTVETVRVVSKDVAIADARYEIDSPGAGAPRQMWSTFVVVRSGDGWRIAALRNMLPAQ